MLERKQKLLSGCIKDRKVRYNYHDARVSHLEAVFARGDRRLGKVILRAVELGCKFDGWNDFFNFDLWMKAFRDCNINPDFYLRERRKDETLPWDHISVGVTKSFLLSEAKKAQRGETTKNCREKCAGCGSNSFGTGVCYE